MQQHLQLHIIRPAHHDTNGRENCTLYLSSKRKLTEVMIYFTETKLHKLGALKFGEYMLQ